jgi:hypothetical protein
MYTKLDTNKARALHNRRMCHTADQQFPLLKFEGCTGHMLLALDVGLTSDPYVPVGVTSQ